MAEEYWTGYVTSKELGTVAGYIDKTLDGVSQDRIVAITHSTTALQFDVWHTAMIVLKKKPTAASSPK